jgi:alpha-beta hydrolase superfamily lysophospholipase
MIKTKDALALADRVWAAPSARAAVVITHGFGEHSGRYAHVADALTSIGVSTYAYDLRGHGQSEGQRGHSPSMDHLLDDLGRVINKARQNPGGERVFVYGHSMGGNITLNYALTRPAGLAGCIATGPWIKRAIEGPAWQIALGRLMSSLVPGFSQQTPSLVGKLSRDPAIDASGNDDPLCHRTMSARLFVECSTGAERLLAQAGELRTPLLLAHGSADAIISVQGSDQFFAACGSADKTYQRYEGYYHEVHNDVGREVWLNDLKHWLSARL